MQNIFLIADLHLGHSNILTRLQDECGKPQRPFASVEEMNETLISNWNAVVTPQDKVYVLGDVVFGRKNLPMLNRLNGTKSLVRGNHDLYMKDYPMYFKNVHTYVTKAGMILTHIPIHPDCVDRYGVNVHGHLHTRTLNDPRYFCISAEQVKYTPIEMNELRTRIAAKLPEWNSCLASF